MNGVDKLVNFCKNEDINNEVLKKLISIDDFKTLSLEKKCELIINIADMLTTEVSLKKNLEVALEHEHTALSEMKETLNKSETQVLELQMEVNRLQEIINQNKIGKF